MSCCTLIFSQNGLLRLETGESFNFQHDLRCLDTCRPAAKRAAEIFQDMDRSKASGNLGIAWIQKDLIMNIFRTELFVVSEETNEPGMVRFTFEMTRNGLLHVFSKLLHFIFLMQYVWSLDYQNYTSFDSRQRLFPATILDSENTPSPRRNVW